MPASRDRLKAEQGEYLVVSFGKERGASWQMREQVAGEIVGEEIIRTVSSSQTLIAVIGPTWLTATDAEGQRAPTTCQACLWRSPHHFRFHRFHQSPSFPIPSARQRES